MTSICSTDYSAKGSQGGASAEPAGEGGGYPLSLAIYPRAVAEGRRWQCRGNSDNNDHVDGDGSDS